MDMTEILKSATAKAVLDSLTPEAREKLLVDAIRYMLEHRESGSYGRTMPTKMEEVFQSAVYSQINEMVKERVNNDPLVKEQLGKVVAKALEVMLTDSNVTNDIAQIIAKVFSKAASRNYD